MSIRANGHWHPNCRCYAVPILKTNEEVIEDNKRILRGEKPIDPSKSQNYVGDKDLPQGFKDWVTNNSERIEIARNRGTLPYFVKDNEDMVNNIIKEGQLTWSDKRDKELRANYIVHGNWTKNLEEKTHVSQFDFMDVKEKVTDIMEKRDIHFDHCSCSLDSNGFSVSYEFNGATIRRSFYPSDEGNGLEVHHDLFTIEDGAKQGGGISKAVFQVFYDQYKKMGVRYISVIANIDVGGYTWARYGFSASRYAVRDAITYNRDEPALVKKATAIVDDFYSKHDNETPFPMNQLVELLWREDAKKLLKGSFWEGMIDLQDPKQRKVFENYMYNR